MSDAPVPTRVEDAHDALRDAAQARLAQLDASGASGWDAPGLDVVRTLVDAAARAPSTLGTHLLGRALEHLTRLEADFGAAQQRATQARDRLATQGLPSAALQGALDTGRLGSLQRAVRRTPRSGPRTRDTLRERLSQKLDAQARARGISSPGLIDAPTTSPSAGLSLSTSLYRDAAAGTAAKLTLAKSAAAVPEDAGRYHALHVAARTLQTAASSPPYLKALLSRLESLSVLWQHGLDE